MKSKQETKREAISYGRFSSEGQSEGDSINRQRIAFESVCHRYSLSPSSRYSFGTFFGKGESGFHAAHLEEGGSLRSFLDLLNSGTINPHATVLVIEMWSRFGRMEPAKAVALLQEVVKTGCVVAVHSPDMWIDTAALASQQFIMVAMCLQMAHSESAEKSRIGKANRERIRQSGKTKLGKVAASCPKWIQPNADATAYELNSFAATLREACLLSIAGHGQTEIAKRLSIPANGLTATFRERTLIGEYQPYSRELDSNGNRLKAGQAKEGYYPALLSVDEFRQLQASVDSRLNHNRKTRGKAVTSLFTGFIFNSKGEALAVKRTSRGETLLKPYGQTKQGKRYLPGKQLDYNLAEEMLLDLFSGLTEEQLYPKDTNAEAKKLNELKAKIEDLTNKVAIWEVEAIEDENAAHLSRLIGNAERKIHELKAEAEALEQTLTVAKSDTLPATQQAISELLAAKEGEDLLDLRTKLKGMLALTVSRITVEVFGTKSAGITVELKNGCEVRSGEFGKVAKGCVRSVGLREIA